MSIYGEVRQPVRAWVLVLRMAREERKKKFMKRKMGDFGGGGGFWKKPINKCSAIANCKLMNTNPTPWLF